MESSHTSPSSGEYYRAAKLERHAFDDVQLALRCFGQGPALVFIHGYPVHGFTWRKLVPYLAKEFTCYVVDLPGLGDSQWTKQSDFSFCAQARRLSLLLDRLGIASCALIAQGAGATIARLVTLARPHKVARLVIFNTEIPGHRPPWIPFCQSLSKLPGSLFCFRAFLASPFFLRSSMGLGGFYSNKDMLECREAVAAYIDPLRRDPLRLSGALAYLQGIEWDIVDGLKDRHLNILADTLFLWGEDDKTFPLPMGRKMSTQFGGRTTFCPIKNASLMPHEEQAEPVLQRLVPFLAPILPDPRRQPIKPQLTVYHASNLSI